MIVQYLRWEMNTETLAFPTDPVVPPSLLICLPALFKNNCSGSQCNEFRTSSKILFNNVLEFKAVFQTIQITAPSGINYDIDTPEMMRAFEKLAVARLTLASSICYQINFTQFYGNESFTQMYVKSSVLPNIFTIVLNDDVASRTFGDTSFLLLSNQVHFVRIDGKMSSFKNSTNTLVSYSKRRLKLLKPPFISNCFDYQAVGLIDQEWCIRTCKLKQLKKYNMSVPLELAYYEFDGERPLANNYAQPGMDMFKVCTRQCSRVSCNVEIVIGAEVTEVGSQDRTSLMILLPSVADINILYGPNMGFGEFVVFIGSILSMWFGLSVFKLSDLLENLIGRYSRC